MAGGYYAPSAGDVLTAANFIDYVSKQVVIICTSGTRPASPRSGMTIWQTDTLTYAVYGTAWCEVTPYASVAGTAGSFGTRASAAFGALTGGSTAAAVTVTTGTKAIVTISAGMAVGTAGAQAYTSAAISGATTVASSNSRSAYLVGNPVNAQSTVSRNLYETGLTAGANVWTIQFSQSSGTLSVDVNGLTVLAIPT